MSDSDLIADLVGPSLAGEEDRSELLAVYGTRILALRREAGYRYLHGEREKFVARLATPRERVEFLLSGWLAADREGWRDWSGMLADAGPVQASMSARCVALAAEVMRSAGSLDDPEQIRADCELVRLLVPGLAELEEEAVSELREAAEVALEAQWWGSEEDLNRQLARIEIVRAVEAAAPEAAETLREIRDEDAQWPLEEEVTPDPLIVRGWREMATALGDDAHERLLEAVPTPPREEQPLLFAEGVATRMVLLREGSYGRGRAIVRTYMSEITNVRNLGNEYFPQARVASEACAWMDPSANQMVWLLRYISSNPVEDTREAVRRWSAGAGRGPTATLVKELMELWIAPSWMGVMRECDFEWAPLLAKVRSVLLSHDSREYDRSFMALSLRELGPRTKNGPKQIARLAAELLNPKRKGHRRNNLKPALLLCEALVGSEQEFPALEKALVAYAKKWKCRYKPDQNRAILMAGIALPESHLSPKARSGLAGTIDEVREIATGLGRAVSALNPLSGGGD